MKHILFKCNTCLPWVCAFEVSINHCALENILILIVGKNMFSRKITRFGKNYLPATHGWEGFYILTEQCIELKWQFDASNYYLRYLLADFFLMEIALPSI